MTISYIDDQEFYYKLLKDHKIMYGYFIRINSRNDILVPNFYYLHGGLEELEKEIPNESVTIIKFMDYKSPYKEETIFTDGTITDAVKWSGLELYKHIYINVTRK